MLVPTTLKTILHTLGEDARAPLLTISFLVAQFAHATSDLYAPPDKCAAVVADFMNLPRPLSGRQIEHYNKFGSTYEMKLAGAWKRFEDDYTTEEIVCALWPLLESAEHDSEVAAVLNAKVDIRYTGGFLSPPFRDGHPKGWSNNKRSSIESVKWDCRRDLGLEHDWDPHPILFRNKSEKEFQALGTNETVRSEWVESFRGWLADERIVSTNPLEIRKILKAASAMDAWELSDEIANLFFYDTGTGKSFRLTDPKSAPRNYYGSFREWEDHPDVPPPFPGVVAPEVLLWRNKDARSKAVSSVLRRYARTDSVDRAETIGGGLADALVISYLQNPSLGLSQEKCRKEIDRLISSDPSLGEDEIATLRHLKEVLSGTKYQVDDGAVRLEWFGSIPLSHRIMPTGDILVGRAVGDRFFAFFNAKGWVGQMRPQWLSGHENAIVKWPKDLPERPDRFYWLNFTGVQDPLQERYLEDYKKKLIGELGSDLLLPDQLPKDASEEEMFYRN